MLKNFPQAILITAYKNVNQINDIINFLGKDFNFYIHIDKKSTMDISKIRDSKNIHVCNEYIVNWGSFNHLKAILLLSKIALKNKKNKYFHLITGQDFPVKPKEYFFYDLDISKDYLQYFKLPIKQWNDGGGIYRFEHYNFFEYFDYKKVTGKLIITFIKDLQKILRIKRKLTIKNFFNVLYGGGTYWSLTRNSLQYVLDFGDKNPEILNSLQFTFCAEELYFQSVLLNSNLHENIVNDNLRYVDWTSGRGGYPAFLDETDYEKIIDTKILFARKFHEISSNGLKNILYYSSFKIRLKSIACQ